MASARVAAFVRKDPRTAEVTVMDFGFLAPLHGHAHVLGLDDDHDAQRLEPLVDEVGDLLGQPFLDLEAAGKVSTTRAIRLSPTIRPPLGM